MESFYFFSIVLILVSAFIGYKNGFLQTILFLFKTAAATAAAYFLYSFVADLFVMIFPSINEWLFPASFLSVFLFVYFIQYLVFTPVIKLLKPYRYNAVNKIAGIVPGATCGIIAITVFICCSQNIAVPAEVDDAINKSRIIDFIKPAGEWVEEKLQPGFNGQPSEATASASENIVREDETVHLSFVTYTYEIRNDLESQMLQMLNEERLKNGLKPLAADAAMLVVARQHSADMFNRGYFSHNTPDSIDPFERIHNAGIIYRIAGENLALSSTLKLAHNSLMNSPGHRANILNPLYGRVGIGILDAGRYGLMISQEFRD